MRMRSGIKRFAKAFIRRALASYSKQERKLRKIRPCISRDEANSLIGEMLNSSKPFMVARFGSVELNAVKHFRKMQSNSATKNRLENMLMASGLSSWPEKILKPLENNAGFFPSDASNAERFAKLMIDAMPSVDLLGSWIDGEGYFEKELSAAKICNLPDIEPYYHHNPWSQHLKGRNVLVIHPFAKSIQQQFIHRREYLFENPLVLPDFNLKTLAAVQSIAGNRPIEHKDWFSALNAMFTNALSFDASVVILGCGAYGFPLASMLKNAGKQVIHLGGATQILFGIKGHRWNTHPIISTLYNEKWTIPREEERPKGAANVENACYW
jgi:hypothetical protein